MGDAQVAKATVTVTAAMPSTLTSSSSSSSVATAPRRGQAARRRNDNKAETSSHLATLPSPPSPPHSSLHPPSRRSRNDNWALCTRVAFSSMAIFARSALAAPHPDGTEGSGRELGHHANIVDLVICLASIIGSLIIIFPYVMSKHSRKLRHSLILGLAVSDLISSLIIVITTGFLLNGGNLIQADRLCTFLGFSLSLSIYTQHFWNLFILFVTYMILVHPLSSFTLTIERRIIWLWPINLIFSLVINGIAWGVAGFSYSNGYCYVGKGAGIIFSSLFQFIPRSIVALVIIVLYTQLFFFLRRTNLMNASSSKAGSVIPTEILSINAADVVDDNHNANSNKSSADDVADSNKSAHGGSTAGGSSGASGSPRGPKTCLPFLSGDGALSTGSNTPSQPGRSPTSFAFGQDSRQGGQASPSVAIEMHDYPAAPASATGVGRQTLQLPSSVSLEPRPERPSLHGRRSRSLSDIGPGSSLDLTRAPTTEEAAASASEKTMTMATATADDSMTQMRRPLLHSAPTEDNSSRISNDSTDEVPDYHTWAGLAPAKRRKDLRDFEMTSPSREQTRRMRGISAMSRPQTAPTRRPSTAVIEMSEASVPERTNRRESSLARDVGGGNEPYPPPPAEGLDENWTWGMDVTQQQGGSGGLTKIQTIGGGLQVHDDNTGAVLHNQSRRGSAANGGSGNVGVAGQLQSRTAAAGAKARGMISSRQTSSTDEHGVENLGSTLNRQASALLLLYPLAYLILFSISLIRIIRDLAEPEKRAARSNDTLANLSRWLIFAQGLLDCIIFKVIERQFRIRMKRKRARARGEDPGRTSLQKIFWWLRRSGRRLMGRGDEDGVDAWNGANGSRRPSVV